MDELSKFRFAPAQLLELEQELIDRADIVFTGGSSLYEAKKDRHDNVHCFPSSGRPRPFRQGARAAVRAGRPGGPAAAAARLLRRDRRALRHRAAGRGRAMRARLVVRDGRSGGEDRPTKTCRSGPTSIISARKTYDRAAVLSGRLGRGADAVRDERVRPSSSRRPRPPNISPAASRSCRPRSRTSCATTAQLEGVQIAGDAGRVRRGLREGARAVAACRRAAGSPRPICCFRRPAGTRPRRAWPA